MTTMIISVLITERRNVMKRMTQDVRRKGFMPCSEKGYDRPTTNQSECTNSRLAARKRALGLSKAENAPKSVFIRDIYTSQVKREEFEVELALYGASQELKLCDEASYLELTIQDWHSMNKCQQVSYIDQFWKLTTEDVKLRKIINVPQGLYYFYRSITNR